MTDIRSFILHSDYMFSLGYEENASCHYRKYRSFLGLLGANQENDPKTNKSYSTVLTSLSNLLNQPIFILNSVLK